MLLPALVLALQATFVSRLEAGLRPGDLALQGASLFRRLRPLIAPNRLTKFAEPFRRVDRDTLFVTVAAPDSDWDRTIVLLWREGGRVRAQAVAPGAGAWLPGPWRRRGNRLFGGVLEDRGNHLDGGGMMELRLRRGRWATTAYRMGDDSADHVSFRFAGPRDDSMIVQSSYALFDTFPEESHLKAQCTARWTYRLGQIKPGPMRRADTALVAFDRFCEAVWTKDRATQRSMCPDRRLRTRAVAVIAKEVTHGLFPTCVASIMNSGDRVFGFHRLGEPKPRPWFFELSRKQGRWVVSRMADEQTFAREMGRELRH
jgi:hypothetical protein